MFGTRLRIWNSIMYNIFMFLLLQAMAFTAAQNGKIEQKLDQEFAVAGSVTPGIITQCESVPKSGACETTYQYTIAPNTFMNQDIMPCSKCRSGESVAIEYLSHNPKQARIEGDKRHISEKGTSLVFSCFAWCFLSLSLVDKNQKKLIKHKMSPFIVGVTVLFWCFAGISFGLSLDLMIFSDIASQPDFLLVGRAVILLWLLLFGFLCLLFNWMTRITLLVSFFLLLFSSLIFGYGFFLFLEGVAGLIWEFVKFQEINYIWAWIFGILGALAGVSVIMETSKS